MDTVFTDNHPETTHQTTSDTANGSMNGTDIALTAAELPTPPVARRLDHFVPGDPTSDTAVLTLTPANTDSNAVAGGADVVILGRGDGNTIEVWRDDTVAVLDGSALAVPVTNPRRCEQQLRAALATVIQSRAQDLAALGRAETEQTTALAEIRDYAIRENRDETICRSGLDEFLDHFNLEPCHTGLRVTYTITGSYDLDSTDSDHAYTDARNYLRVDLGQVDDVVEESDSFYVEVDTVDPIDD